MIPERNRYQPPTAEQVAADLAAISSPPQRPHAGTDPWPHGHQHTTTTCSSCCPPIGGPAWQRGVERASVHQEFLPMSSAGHEPRPGRDGYDDPDTARAHTGTVTP